VHAHNSFPPQEDAKELEEAGQKLAAVCEKYDANKRRVAPVRTVTKEEDVIYAVDGKLDHNLAVQKSSTEHNFISEHGHFLLSKKNKPMVRCGTCHRAFSDKSQLNRHLKRKAEMVERFYCPLCDYSEPMASNRWAHLKVHNYLECDLVKFLAVHPKHILNMKVNMHISRLR